MPKLENILNESVIHSVRSDGSKMIAIQEKNDAGIPIWELFFVEKDGRIANDGTIVLPSKDKAVLRKTVTSEQLAETANRQDFVEWQPGFLEGQADEQTLVMQDKIRKAEERLQEVTTQKATVEEQLQESQKKVNDLLTAKRKERSERKMDLDAIEQKITSTAAAIAERTPSHTQKIIANQVELSAGYYEEVGNQSRDSFQLSLWLTVAGGTIFLSTAIATIFISLLRGDTTLFVIVGSCAAAITELLAAINHLYNQASQQLAAFQTYLDRINRSSICYSMISEEEFEKKTDKQQEVIEKIVTSLLGEK